MNETILPLLEKSDRTSRCGREHQEIERKFLLASLPEEIEYYPRVHIRQGYLAISPDGVEVRLRRENAKYYETIKLGSGKTRAEYEIELTEAQFTVLWGATAGRQIEKTRYKIPNGQNLIELDVYRGRLEGLLTAEIEFDSEELSNTFSPPPWFDREVTHDERYKNRALVLYGIPDVTNNPAFK